MTTLQDYYANLLIIQYNGLPKASQTIRLLTEVASGDEILNQLPEAFDVDTSVGAQLDLIGQFVGADRYGLSDDEYRILIKFKIIVNNIGASMKSIDDAIFNTFGTSIVVSNNKDMTMTYIIEPLYKNVVEAAYKLGFLPVPLAVGVNVILMVPNPDLIFGFKRGMLETNAIGFSTKDKKRQATWLTKDNILTGGGQWLN